MLYGVLSDASLCPTFAVVEKRYGIAMPPKKPRLGFEWQSSTVVICGAKVQNFSQVGAGLSRIFLRLGAWKSPAGGAGLSMFR